MYTPIQPSQAELMYMYIACSQALLMYTTIQHLKAHSHTQRGTLPIPKSQGLGSKKDAQACDGYRSVHGYKELTSSLEGHPPYF